MAVDDESLATLKFSASRTDDADDGIDGVLPAL